MPRPMAEPRSISTMSVAFEGGRRSRLTASIVPQKPAPMMAMVLAILENSIKQVFHTFDNILQTSWSNGGLDSSEGQLHATQQVELLLGLRRLSPGARRPDGGQCQPCHLGERHGMARCRHGGAGPMDPDGVCPASDRVASNALFLAHARRASCGAAGLHRHAVVDQRDGAEPRVPVSHVVLPDLQ